MKLITRRGSLNTREFSQRSFLTILITLIGLWSIGPIYWIFITGLKQTGEVYLYPPTLVPTTFTFENILYIFTERPFAYYLRNSTIVSVVTVLVSTTFATMAGYSFAKFRFRGKKLLLLLIILTRTVPPASLLVPFYAIGRAAGLINTHTHLS